MKNTSDESSRRWTLLVRNLAPRKEELTAAFIDELSQNPSYSPELVPHEDVLTVSENSIAVLIEALSTGPTDANLSSHSKTLGRRRARQGVAGDDLIAAIRLNFKIIWSFMLNAADDEDVPVLARHVDRLAAVVDEYARQVQEGYLTERALMALEVKSEQQRYIASLFAPEGRATGRLEQIALSLGVKSDGEFWVCAATGPNARRLQHVAEQLTRRDVPIFTHHYDMDIVAFWPAHAVADSSAGSQLDALKDLPCGLVGSMHGLRSVPQAAACAMRIAEVLRGDELRPTTVQDAWARLARRHLDGEIDFTAQVLGTFHECPDHEQERLTEVVLAYLASGSVSGAAENLYCHRNTVQNWLNRFQKLTGLDVSTPLGAALACVALA